MNIMTDFTTISLGDYYENFVDHSISEGRYENSSEVIRAGLRLLEEEENKLQILKKAINEGIENEIDYDFDPNNHLQLLKSKNKSV
jgi:antitoxin ParD1/3/4